MIDLNGYSVLEKRIPEGLFNVLKAECLQCEQKNEKRFTALSGVDSATHYTLENTREHLNKYLEGVFDEYFNTFPNYLNTFQAFTNAVPFHIGKPWINIQRKNQFLPMHHHDGVLSYSIWIKIPYNLDEELKGSSFSSLFEFNYINNLGQLTQHKLNVDKSWEGKMIVFPSIINHLVYPFRTVDDNRISVSGNLLFDTRKLKDVEYLPELSGS